jgi:hypothetical protein
MIVRRMGPLSLAKLSATLYGLIGLLIGGVVSLVSVVGGAMAGNEAGPLGMLFGVAAVILLPVFYGCIGFVTSLIGASLYNLVAGWVGGIELEVE